MATPTPEEILEAARLAVDSFFRGEFSSKRSIRQDMSDLRALLREYDSKQETTRLTKEKA